MTTPAMKLHTKTTSRQKAISTCSGFTLIELILALGLGSLCVAVFSNGFLEISKSSYFVQQSATRSSLMRSIRSSVLDHRAFMITATRDPLVHAVVTNNFSAVGGTLNTNQFYDISLYDSSGTRIAGTQINPVLYMADGSTCPAGLTFGNGPCVIAATSTMMVEGLPDSDHMNMMSSVLTLPIIGYTTPSYPSGSPSLRAELLLISYEVKISTKHGHIVRKTARGSVFINVKDLGF